MTLREILEAEIEQLEKEYDRALTKSAAYVGSGEDGGTDAETEQAARDRDRIAKQLEEQRAELKRLNDDDPYDGVVGISKAG